MGLTTSGIIFLSLAWGIITVLVIYCFAKVLSSEKKGER
jgi:branched-subunit amino acid transport protein AzlD